MTLSQIIRWGWHYHRSSSEGDIITHYQVRVTLSHITEWGWHYHKLSREGDIITDYHVRMTLSQISELGWRYHILPSEGDIITDYCVRVTLSLVTKWGWHYHRLPSEGDIITSYQVRVTLSQITKWGSLSALAVLGLCVCVLAAFHDCVRGDQSLDRFIGHSTGMNVPLTFFPCLTFLVCGPVLLILEFAAVV